MARLGVAEVALALDPRRGVLLPQSFLAGVGFLQQALSLAICLVGRNAQSMRFGHLLGRLAFYRPTRLLG